MNNTGRGIATFGLCLLVGFSYTTEWACVATLLGAVGFCVLWDGVDNED